MIGMCCVTCPGEDVNSTSSGTRPVPFIPAPLIYTSTTNAYLFLYLCRPLGPKYSLDPESTQAF